MVSMEIPIKSEQITFPCTSLLLPGQKAQMPLHFCTSTSVLDCSSLGQKRKIAAVNTARATARIYQAQQQHHLPQLPQGLKSFLCSAFSALKAGGGGCSSLLEPPHNSPVYFFATAVISFLCKGIHFLTALGL